jgi:hypothetical protein
MVGFYVLYYPILVTPLLFAADAVSITRLALAQVTTQSIAYVIFVLFPTPIDRPPAVPVESASHYVLDLLFRADHPYNTFPSMHVAQSCIVAVFFLKFAASWPAGLWPARAPKLLAHTSPSHPSTLSSHTNARLSSAVLIFHGAAAILISASAVMIKQHYVADAAAGVLLTAIVSYIFFRKSHSFSLRRARV